MRAVLVALSIAATGLIACNRGTLHELDDPPGPGDRGGAQGDGTADPGDERAGDSGGPGDSTGGDPGTFGDPAAGDASGGGDLGGPGDPPGDPNESGDPAAPGDPAGDPLAGDVAGDAAGGDAAGGDPTPPTACCTDSTCTPARGSYSYDRLALGSLGETVRVAFHPDGTYAVLLERFGGVHLLDWESQTASRFEPAGSVYWTDVEFVPDGSAALLVGYDSAASNEGVVYRLDDSGWRAHFGGDTSATVLTRLTAATQTNAIFAIAFPWDASANPVLLSRPASYPYNYVTLRDLDVATGSYGSLLVAQSTTVGCDDLAFAANEFGAWGILVICGSNGGDTLFYTEVGGVGEWRVDPGNTNLGNTSRAAAHCGGDYALVVSWSGRALYRCEAGSLNGYGDAPRFSTQGIWGLGFQPDGRRALIVGRAGGNPLRGTVIEYRHGAYDCPAPYSDCGLTDVSIPGFDGAPYLGTANTYLYDAAFRAGCDGGLIVGGETSGNRGLAIEFAVAGGTACR